MSDNTYPTPTATLSEADKDELYPILRDLAFLPVKMERLFSDMELVIKKLHGHVWAVAPSDDRGAKDRREWRAFIAAVNNLSLENRVRLDQQLGFKKADELRTQTVIHEDAPAHNRRRDDIKPAQTKKHKTVKPVQAMTWEEAKRAQDKKCEDPKPEQGIKYDDSKQAHDRKYLIELCRELCGVYAFPFQPHNKLAVQLTTIIALSVHMKLAKHTISNLIKNANKSHA